eukprot:gb/GEZJ01001365.1/.p1 GENE.gb/GEZJ01001365.1/~~gb/GEZJ01001365.1/.p1  ORF type:complete len:281 (+),score=37.67 gb/GEZJ01001365.1/:90-845(+)
MSLPPLAQLCEQLRATQPPAAPPTRATLPRRALAANEYSFNTQMLAPLGLLPSALGANGGGSFNAQMLAPLGLAPALGADGAGSLNASMLTPIDLFGANSADETESEKGEAFSGDESDESPQDEDLSDDTQEEEEQEELKELKELPSLQMTPKLRAGCGRDGAEETGTRRTQSPAGRNEGAKGDGQSTVGRAAPNSGTRAHAASMNILYLRRPAERTRGRKRSRSRTTEHSGGSSRPRGHKRRRTGDSGRR